MQKSIFSHMSMLWARLEPFNIGIPNNIGFLCPLLYNDKNGTLYNISIQGKCFFYDFVLKSSQTKKNFPKSDQIIKLDLLF